MSTKLTVNNSLAMDNVGKEFVTVVIDLCKQGSSTKYLLYSTAVKVNASGSDLISVKLERNTESNRVISGEVHFKNNLKPIISDDTSLRVNNISYKRYISNSARLASYKNSPEQLKVKSQQFSDSGFFYTGVGDQTICFCCGGGLKDWEDQDDPWTVHAKWFHKCKFLLLAKGKDFVNAAGKYDCNIVVPKNRTLPTTECKICLSDEVQVVFYPCKHLIACASCALCCTRCSVCRESIESFSRVFLS